MRGFALVLLFLAPLAGATPSCECTQDGQVSDPRGDAVPGADVTQVMWGVAEGGVRYDRETRVTTHGAPDRDMTWTFHVWQQRDGAASITCITVHADGRTELAYDHPSDGTDPWTDAGDCPSLVQGWNPATWYPDGLGIPYGPDTGFHEDDCSMVMVTVRDGGDLVETTQAVPVGSTSGCPVSVSSSCTGHCTNGIPPIRPAWLIAALLGLAWLRR